MGEKTIKIQLKDGKAIGLSVDGGGISELEAFRAQQFMTETMEDFLKRDYRALKDFFIKHVCPHEGKCAIIPRCKYYESCPLNHHKGR